MLVRNFRQRLNVCHVPGGIADTFAIDGPRVFVDQFLDIVGGIAGRKAPFDSLLGQDVRKQCVRSTIKLRQRHNVVAHLRDIDERIVNRRHPRADAERFNAAFEGSDTLFQTVFVGFPIRV